MAHLDLVLFGALAFRLDGQRVDGLLTDKARALLVYLAVEADRPHRREELAALLWPERSEANARANLSQALFKLRSLLGDRAAGDRAKGELAPAAIPFLSVSGPEMQFNLASDHTADSRAFAALVAVCAEHAHRPGEECDPCVQRLSEAVALYRGGFLQDLSMADSAPFEEWATVQREQHLRQVLDALQRLAAAHERRGDTPRGVEYARRQVALDPWGEEGQRQLMRLLALSGQRGAALAQYEACRRVLSEELGAEPEEGTTALYEQIRQGALRVPSPISESSPLPFCEPPSPVRMATTASRPPESPVPLFVAREKELAQLDRWLGEALAGQGRVGFVVGEPGSGKTVLLREFAERAMRAHPELIVAGGSGNAYAGIGDPYLPFVEVLQLLTGDTEPREAGGTLTPEHARRLRSASPLAMQALVEHGPELLDALLPGAELLRRARALAPRGAPWRERLEEIAQASAARRGYPGVPQAALLARCARVLCALAGARPLLLLLDDLQWADASSVSLLFHLGRKLAGQRLLVLGAYRPVEVAAGRQGEPHPLEPVVREFQQLWGDRPLDLSQAEGRQFVNALIDSAPNRLGSEFREALYRHTEGHALFTVELLRALEDRGDLQRDAEGFWCGATAPQWGTLPTRVEAMIARQMQRLPPELRALLTTASVEGEEFTAEVVARVRREDEQQVITCLSEALGAERHLVYPLSTQRVPPGAGGTGDGAGRRLSRYRFRHYLFQAHLYQSLDEVQRATLHEQVGSALEALHGAVPPSAPLEPGSWTLAHYGIGEETYAEAAGAAIAPQLAWHFERAGLADKAVAYLQRAAERALHGAAFQEASAYLQRAIPLVQALSAMAAPDQPPGAGGRAWVRTECLLQSNLAALAVITKSSASPEFGQASQRAYVLALQLSDLERIVASIEWLSSYHRNRAEYDRSLQLEEEGITWAQRGSSAYHALFLALAGHSLFLRGQFVAARARMEQALDLAAQRLEGGERVYANYTAMNHLVLALWHLGYPDQASQMNERGPGPSPNPDLRYGNNLEMAKLLRQWGRVQEITEAKLHPKPEEVLWGFWATMALVNLGWAHAHVGRAEEGAAEIQRGLETWHAIGMRVLTSGYLTMLGEAHALAGRVDKGLACLDQALAHVESTGERYHEAEIYRIKGEMLLQRGDAPDQAEACFRRSIAVAPGQEAKSWELRATTSLARLWQRQGRAAEAREALAAIYGWFTEGFDTPDLQGAKALLNTLS